MNFNPALYLVTDRLDIEEELFLHKIEQALRGGVTLVQLREKEATTREYLNWATKVKRLTDSFGVPLIIDDRIDVAMACDACGVHLGQCDMPVLTARRILGENKIIGATAKTASQAKEAMKGGANYLGVGAIYPTTTKVKTVITEVSVLSDICRLADIPVVAIGGLNKDNIEILRGIPIDGVAVVSAIMKSGCCESAAKELRTILKEGWGLA